VWGRQFGSRRLLSPDDQNVRPMMEKVRGAVFSILQSYLSAPGGLPAGSRWLDLFSGTGAVGLEGMSRGADEVCLDLPNTRMGLMSPLLPISSAGAHTRTAHALQADKSAVATVSKTKELKKRSWGQERVVSSVLEAVPRASGSSFQRGLLLHRHGSTH